MTDPRTTIPCVCRVHVYAVGRRTEILRGREETSRSSLLFGLHALMKKPFCPLSNIVQQCLVRDHVPNAVYSLRTKKISGHVRSEVKG